MNEETSCYLDLARFLAAIEVLITHARRESITGGFLSSIGQYGHEAVAVFFVVSGVVISHSVRKRSGGPTDYFIARLSRLWSVVVPAVVLTIVLDATGHWLAPQLYEIASLQPLWHLNFDSLGRALAPIFFVNQISLWDISPGTNGPFWSLPCEFWYYLTFGAIYYLRGRLQYILLILVVLIAGPRTLSLAPIWAMGVGLYFLLGKGRPSPFYWILWVASAVGIIAVLVLKFRIFGAFLKLGGLDGLLCETYPIAILFTVNLFAFDRVSSAFFGITARVGHAIHACAARTFSLYLYQAPLLFFMAALTFRLHDRSLRILAVYAGTLISIVILAGFTELRRRDVAKWLRSFLKNGLEPIWLKIAPVRHG